MNSEWTAALIGGLIIGFSVTIMLLFNGRVTGISGIISGILSPVKNDYQWRVYFIGGLILGGFILNSLNPTILANTLDTSSLELVFAGLLVGFGTLLGSGCTSGHGVCGISRLSLRSILATVSFIFAGVLTVYLIRNLGA